MLVVIGLSNAGACLAQSHKELRFDTSKIAILTFVQKYGYPFDRSYKPATLTHEDLANIDSLFLACVADYNKPFDKNRSHWRIELNKRTYRKQLIAVTNKKGEKEVWVNCFCDTWGDDRWKTEMLLVDDGGNCYFNFKINLATKQYYELLVNGLA